MILTLKLFSSPEINHKSAKVFRINNTSNTIEIVRGNADCDL